jgi:hypothetical protein
MLTSSIWLVALASTVVAYLITSTFAARPRPGAAPDEPITAALPAKDVIASSHLAARLSITVQYTLAAQCKLEKPALRTLEDLISRCLPAAPDIRQARLVASGEPVRTEATHHVSFLA